MILVSNSNIWQCKLEFKITTEMLKNISGKVCTNLTARKNPVALPDTIHNACVWVTAASPTTQWSGCSLL